MTKEIISVVRRCTISIGRKNLNFDLFWPRFETFSELRGFSVSIQTTTLTKTWLLSGVYVFVAADGWKINNEWENVTWNKVSFTVFMWICNCCWMRIAAIIYHPKAAQLIFKEFCLHHYYLKKISKGISNKYTEVISEDGGKNTCSLEIFNKLWRQSRCSIRCSKSFRWDDCQWSNCDQSIKGVSIHNCNWLLEDKQSKSEGVNGIGFYLWCWWRWIPHFILLRMSWDDKEINIFAFV